MAQEVRALRPGNLAKTDGMRNSLVWVATDFVRKTDRRIFYPSTVLFCAEAVFRFKYAQQTKVQLETGKLHVRRDLPLRRRTEKDSQAIGCLPRPKLKAVDFHKNSILACARKIIVLISQSIRGICTCNLVIQRRCKPKRIEPY